MVGQVAVSPIEGSTTTDYVVRNAVLHCSLPGEGILPYRLPACECPLDIRSWLTHCSDQLSYRPLTCLLDLRLCWHWRSFGHILDCMLSALVPMPPSLRSKILRQHIPQESAFYFPLFPPTRWTGAHESGSDSGIIRFLLSQE